MSKKVLTIILVIVIVALTGFMIWGMAPSSGLGWNQSEWVSFNCSGFHFGGFASGGRLPEDAQKGTSYETDTAGISGIDLNFQQENIEVTVWDKDIVRVEQISDAALPDEDIMRFGTIGSELAIQSGNYGKIITGIRPRSTIKLYIPQKSGLNIKCSTASGYVHAGGGKYALLRIDTASGETSLSGVNAKDVEVDTASGRVKIEDVDCKQLKIDSASGDITVSGVCERNMDIDTSSGSITVNAQTESLKVDTASGSVAAEISGLRVFDVDTASGNVRLACRDAQALQEIKIGTMSGEVEIDLPENDGFEVDFDSISGRVQYNGFEVYNDAYANETIQIGVDTVSGDLRITKK
ncbi:MAG: DUF4097 family beta strand repeat-containing protein [Christensenellaceae bacterium]|jgi:hypothetical protein